MNWTCPQCGETNPDTTKLCGLCGEMRPAVKAEQVVVRAMGPSPSATLPTVTPGSDRWAPRDPARPSEAEKQRLAEQAAQQIMGTTAPAGPSTVGCGNLAMFIMFLPWSLLVLPMPGGLRNRNVGRILLVIGAMAVLVGILSLMAVAPHVMKLAHDISAGYNVPDTGN
ncbi:MAG TPA: zinc ribbon domain-containing protein [Armatimonadota bacterium]|jgi:hypothetical protein